MLAGSLRKLALSALTVAMAMGASDASAFWGHGSSGGSSGGWSGSSGGSSGGYSGSSGGWSGSSGGSNGGWGHRHHHLGLFGRWRHRSGSSGGSSGGWGSSGGYGYGNGYGHGSSGGSSGGWGGYSNYGSSGGSSGGYSNYSGYGDQPVYENGTIIENGSTNETPADDQPADAEVSEPSASNSRYRTSGYVANSTAILNVRVPEDARVFVNGAPTTSTGAQRRFVSKNLRSGFTYTYEIRAERDIEGQTVTETKVFKIAAGQNVNHAFALSGESREDRVAKVRTSLTLNVPSEARVYLAGQETKSAGATREFSTMQLAEGQHWADYDIRIELDRDGETLVEERTVSLNGGDEKSLTVDFDVARLASAK